MYSASFVFMLLIVLIGCCQCRGDDEVKSVKTRRAYGPPRRPDERDDPQGYINDFIIRESSRDSHPPPPPPPNHHQGPYHHHHGPPDQTYYPHHHHEDSIRPANRVDSTEGVDFSSLNSSGIPLDFAKSINEYTVSDLLLNVIEDGPEENVKPFVISRFGGDEGNETEKGAAQIARPAKCIPELTTVRIAQSNDPNVFFVPECTRVERCGGCCSHKLLACQPVETEAVTFTVIKTEYTGTKKLRYIGKEPILVEKHTKCKCGCKIKAEDCNSYQEYRESECRCLCKNIDEEKKCYKSSYKKLWNPDVCACQCREVLECSTGFQFDYNECTCVKSQLQRRYILTEIRKEQPDPPPQEKDDTF